MQFDEIDGLQAKLKTMRPLGEAELKRLREEFMIENTYDSNAIEGNTLTLRETALILQAGITIAEKPIRDHLEALGHRDAFGRMIALADARAPLSEQVIKELHALVLMDDAANRGKYREVPVVIVGASHTPPEPGLVGGQMESLLIEYEEMKRSVHIVEAIAEFHLRFEGIHPFIDGNGRTGRLVMNFELIKAGLLPVNIKFKDRRRYFECFEHYALTEGAPYALADMIAGYEADELRRYIAILERPHQGRE